MPPRHRTHTLTVVARALLGDAQRLVMCRNIRDQFYFLPGGTLEPGESVRHCLARELQEEMAFDATIGPFVGCIENHWQDERHAYQEFNIIFRVPAPPTLLNGPIASRLPHIAFEAIALQDLQHKDNVLPKQLTSLLAQYEMTDDESNSGPFLEQNPHLAQASSVVPDYTVRQY